LGTEVPTDRELPGESSSLERGNKAGVDHVRAGVILCRLASRGINPCWGDRHVGGGHDGGKGVLENRVESKESKRNHLCPIPGTEKITRAGKLSLHPPGNGRGGRVGRPHLGELSAQRIGKSAFGNNPVEGRKTVTESGRNTASDVRKGGLVVQRCARGGTGPKKGGVSRNRFASDPCEKAAEGASKS